MSMPVGWDKTFTSYSGATVNAGTSAGQTLVYNTTSGEYDATSSTGLLYSGQSLKVNVGATTTGINDIAMNPAVKASGNFIDLKLADAARFSVGYNGVVTVSSSVATPAVINGSTMIITYQAGGWVTGTGSTNSHSFVLAADGARSSGIHDFVKFSPSYANNTGTAGWNGLLINVTDGSGSGAKNLIDAKVGSVSKWAVTSTGIQTQQGLSRNCYTSASFADDATVTMATSKAGWGTATIGDNQEYIHFTFSTTAATRIYGSANSSATSADTFLCAFVDSNNLKVSNKLGAPLSLRVEVNYS